MTKKIRQKTNIQLDMQSEKKWFTISLMIHCKKKDDQQYKNQSYAIKMLQKNTSNLHMKILFFTDMPLLKFTQENMLEKRDLKKAISSQQIKSYICCNSFKINTFQTLQRWCLITTIFIFY